MSPKPIELTRKATSIRPTKTMPFQKALKLPATKPERIASDAPPWRPAETISATCLDLAEVKTLVSSGITAAAMVPQLMIMESFHHTVPSPRSWMRSELARKVAPIETIEEIQTSEVSGPSKSK